MATPQNKEEVWLHHFVQLYGNEAWLPLAIGCIAAHCRSDAVFSDTYSIAPLVYQREEPNLIVGKYRNPKILGFSCYIWNMQLSLAVARIAKERYPEALTVFGGPSVPEDGEEFLRLHPYVDVLALGEGETIFLDVALALKSGRPFSDIAGLSFLDGGAYVKTPSRPYSRELDDFASPFLDGTFDALVQGPHRFNLIWETNRGCPFACGFCYWGKGTTSVKSRYGDDRLRLELDWIQKNKIELVYLADANFGINKRDLEIAQSLVDLKNKYGYPKSMIVNYAKNSDEKVFQIAKLFKESGLMKPVTLSYQSLDPEALRLSRRANIKLDLSEKLRKRYHQEGINTYTDLLLGLAGETLESFKSGVEQTFLHGEHDVILIYPVRLLPNTDMARPEFVRENKIDARSIPLQANHGNLTEDEPVAETESVVISTATLPPDDWLQAMVIAWYAQAFLCLKLGYFISLFLYHHLGIGIMRFADYVLASLQGAPDKYPLLARELERAEAYGRSIQEGDPKIDMSDIPVFQIRWPLEELTFMKVSLNRDVFYTELRQIMNAFLSEARIDCNPVLLDEVFTFQQASLIAHGNNETVRIGFEHNVAQFFQAARSLEPIKIVRKASRVEFMPEKSYETFDDFARYRVWYGRRGTPFIREFNVTDDGESVETYKASA